MPAGTDLGNDPSVITVTCQAKTTFKLGTSGVPATRIDKTCYFYFYFYFQRKWLP